MLRIVEQLRSAARPIIEDLGSVGVKVESVWDFVNTNEKYERAVPVLLKHLQRDYPNRIRDGLARSLGRPWARSMAWEQVLAAYLAEPNKSRVAPPGQVGSPGGPKDGMAVALSEMARPEDLDVIIDLISDPKNGLSRIFFVKNLSRSRSSKAFETLSRLSRDPELHKEVECRLQAKLRREAKKAGSKSARQ